MLSGRVCGKTPSMPQPHPLASSLSSCSCSLWAERSLVHSFSSSQSHGARIGLAGHNRRINLRNDKILRRQTCHIIPCVAEKSPNDVFSRPCVELTKGKYPALQIEDCNRTTDPGSDEILYSRIPIRSQPVNIAVSSGPASQPSDPVSLEFGGLQKAAAGFATALALSLILDASVTSPAAMASVPSVALSATNSYSSSLSFSSSPLFAPALPNASGIMDSAQNFLNFPFRSNTAPSPRQTPTQVPEPITMSPTDTSVRLRRVNASPRGRGGAPNCNSSANGPLQPRALARPLGLRSRNLQALHSRFSSPLARVRQAGGSQVAARPLCDHSEGERSGSTSVCASASAAAAVAAVATSPVTATFSLPALSSYFDWTILHASLMASVKLFGTCAFVVALQKSGVLPESTPALLSKISFTIFLPAYNLSKVAATLHGQHDPGLFFVPLVAIAQVFVGAALGKAMCQLAYHSPFSSPSPSSTAVASSVTSGMGLREGSFPPSSLAAPPGVGALSKINSRKESVVMAACAFGNSVTLPLLFLNNLLPSAEADRAAGYIALFTLGWSPALWSLGYKIIAGEEEEEEAEERRRENGSHGQEGGFLASLMPQLASTAKSVLNPPMFGVLLGILIGASPLSHLFFPSSATSFAVAATSANPVSAAALAAASSPLLPSQAIAALSRGALSPILECATLLGSATLAVQTTVLASSLASSVPSRLPSFLCLPSWPASPSAPPQDSPALAPLLLPASSSASDPLSLAASAAWQRASGIPTPAGPGHSAALSLSYASADASLSPSATAPCPPPLLPAEKQLPELAGPSLLDGRALWVVSAVRLVLMPAVGVVSTLALRKAHLIPSDPACILVLMLEAAMPSAQNLVLLSQLRPGTRALAGVLASLMLRQYALAVIPITMWLTLFLAVSGPLR